MSEVIKYHGTIVITREELEDKKKFDILAHLSKRYKDYTEGIREAFRRDIEQVRG